MGGQEVIVVKWTCVKWRDARDSRDARDASGLGQLIDSDFTGLKNKR